MTNRTTWLLLFAGALTAMLSGLGCGPKPYDVEHPATPAAASRVDAAAASPTAAEPLHPLLGPARAHPAPIGTPELDRAETDAAAHPGDVAANRTLAFTYYKLQAYAQAVPAFQKVVALAPGDAAGYLYLGCAQFAQGALNGAIATLLKVPDLTGVTPANISEAYCEIGSGYWVQKRDDQAAEAWTRSLEADPHQGQASLGLGTYDASRGRRQKAHDAFVAAVRDLPAGPARAQAFACLGRLAEEDKDNAGAVAAYKQSLALDPKNVWANLALKKRLTTPK